MNGLPARGREEQQLPSDKAPPTEWVGRQVKLHRRELMAAEFERLALELFAERGDSNVPVEDIADAAREPRPSLDRSPSERSVLSRY